MDIPSIAPAISAHGKFFEHAGRKFFLKATRFEDGATAADFDSLLRLRSRLEVLKEGKTTALVVRLEDAEAETILDVAAQVGLCALLEIHLEPETLLATRSFREVAARIRRITGLF